MNKVMAYVPWSIHSARCFPRATLVLLRTNSGRKRHEDGKTKANVHHWCYPLS